MRVPSAILESLCKQTHTIVNNPGVVAIGHISNHRARPTAHTHIILLHVPYARGTFFRSDEEERLICIGRQFS